MKFQVPSAKGSLVLKQTKGVTDERTDGRTYGQTDWPKQICPLNFFELRGIIMHKCGSYGPDKLNL